MAEIGDSEDHVPGTGKDSEDILWSPSEGGVFKQNNLLDFELEDIEITENSDSLNIQEKIEYLRHKIDKMNVDKTLTPTQIKKIKKATEAAIRRLERKL